MKYSTSYFVILLLCGWTAASAQSLVEVAKREKERREKIREQMQAEPSDAGSVRNGEENHAEPEQNPLSSNNGARETPPSISEDESSVPSLADAVAGEDKVARSLNRDRNDEIPSHINGFESQNGPPTSLPRNQEKPLDDVQPSKNEDASLSNRDAETSGGMTVPAGTAGSAARKQGSLTPRNEIRSEDLHLRGALYVDWFRAAYPGDVSSGQLSNRVKLEAGRRPGDGWRIRLDVRNRLNRGARSSNQLIVYDAYMMLDDKNKPLSLSLGQMNLYDSSGIGVLLGGLLGYRIGDALTVGGYGGLQPQIYDYSVDSSYQKFGAFARYDGVDAKSLTISYNTIRFAGQTERRFLYSSGLIPLERLVLYGNMEYELGSNIAGGDRLSRVFMNARFNVTETIDVTGHYSSGRGLDYHRFLLEQSQSLNVSSSELERFYYSEQYGVRLGYRFHPQMRVFVEQRRSEQKDRLIVNNTTRLGGSAYDIAGSGFSLYGSYNINRGDASESNSFQFSASRDFGRLSWTGYFSTSFNGIRFDAVSGRPVIIHVDDRRTLSNDFFFVLTRALALSLEYEYSVLGEESENTLFARGIYRF